MSLPSVEQYLDLVSRKHPKELGSLASYNFLKDGNDFITHTGTSAFVFEAMSGSKKFAVRFFIRAESQTSPRYQQLSHYFLGKHLPWLVPFLFLNNEVTINGQLYPVVLMDWAEGVPLNEFVDTHLYHPEELSLVQEQLVALHHNMEANGMAHGDLKYNNIFVQPDYSLKLIDYDTMYIPVFEGQKSTEIGSPGFQPLKRLNAHFNEKVDRFSVWVLLASLEAIKAEPLLWSQMESGGLNNDHSLFTLSDLFKPQQSTLVHQLRSLDSGALHFYLDQFLGYATTSDLDEIPKPVLFDNSSKAANALAANGSSPKARGIDIGKNVEPPKNGSSYSKPANGQPRKEEEAILEFSAEPSRVREGESSTLRWKVKGESDISISHLGAVTEKWGSRSIAPRQSTRYELKIGGLSKSLAVEVEPMAIPKPEATPQKRRQHRIAATEQKKAPNWRLIGIVAAALFVIALVVFFLPRQRNDSNMATASISMAEAAPAFSPESVKRFLEGLYGAYNQRNLSSIVSHYAPFVNEYYESKTVSQDSLRSMITDLFITPAAYSCTPDYSTLKVESVDDKCRVRLTIKEKLQTDKSSPAEEYTTDIQYVIDPSYKIVAEKSSPK